jgi:glycosyltransferase involved in cell wall biosynthesis
VSSHSTGGSHTRTNVLLAVPFDDTRGGVISVVDNLARQLQASGQKALFFHSAGTILTDRVTKLGFDGVQLRLSLPLGPGVWRGALRTVLFPFLFVSTLAQLIWFLRSRRIDIVNLHFPIDNYVYFALCRRLLPFKLVTSIHGQDAFVRERPKDTYSRAFTFILESSDLLVLPSDAYRRKLLEAFPRLHDRTIFIHNGIDPAQFSAADRQPDDDRRRNGRYILCVAELKDNKAIDVLLQAASPLLAQDPSLTLVLAGDGPLRGELERMASSLGIRSQTMFLGTQGGPEIARLMRGCELMVLPSRVEPFGIVLIEAMASKTPVVATNVGGIPEIVDHEITGILTEPENPQALTAALQRVLADSGLRTRLVRNGHSKMMQRFCATHNGAAYLAAFASILQQPRSSAQSPLSAGPSGRGANAPL